MAKLSDYITQKSATAEIKLLDSITTSATATYALTNDGVAYTPSSARSLLVSLNGVTQAPESAYDVSGTNIVFDSALTADDVIDYILVISQSVDIGTPSDNTVGNAQLKSDLDFSGKTLTFSADQISGDAINGGTISSFASTGIDDNATSTAVTLDSSGNVSTTERLRIGTGSSDTRITLNNEGTEQTNSSNYIRGVSGQLIYNSASGVHKWEIAGSEKMRIDSSGNVSVDRGQKIQWYDGTVGSGNVNAAIEGTGDPALKLYTRQGGTSTLTERMRIDSNGNVGIGTSSPSGLLKTLNIDGGSQGSSIALDGGSNFSVIYTGATAGDPTSLFSNTGFKFATAADKNATGFAEAMRIDASGNVGIGTTSPSGVLAVTDGANALIVGQSGENFYSGNTHRFFSQNYTTEHLHINASGNVGIGTTTPNSAGLGINGQTLQLGTRTFIATDAGGDTRLGGLSGSNITGFYQGGTERMRIDASGYLCIGTTGMTQGGSGPLQVYSAGGSQLILGKASGAPSISFGSTTTAYGLIEGITGGGFTFYTGNGTLVNRLAIDASGYLISQTTYNATTGSAANMHVLSSGVFLRSVSSIKYKTGVEDAWLDYAKKLYDLRPVYYKSLGEFDNPDWSYWGFIAEEVAEVDPRLAHFKTTETSFDENGERVETQLAEPEAEGVQYDRMVPLLLMLMKEQKEQIETLQAEVAALKGA